MVIKKKKITSLVSNHNNINIAKTLAAMAATCEKRVT